MSAARRSSARVRFATLTPREREVVLLIARGRNNLAIAEELGISRETVKRHVSSILKKVDRTNRTEVALDAVAQGYR